MLPVERKEQAESVYREKKWHVVFSFILRIAFDLEKKTEKK
jgi:hypothetical protein